MNGEGEVNTGVLVRQKGGFPQEEDGLGRALRSGRLKRLSSSRVLSG